MRVLRLAFLSLLVLLAVLLLGQVAHGQEDNGSLEYTVQPGDTLLLIAQRFHVPLDLLAQANHIADPNLIQVGQVLTIPGRDEVAQVVAMRAMSGADRQLLTGAPLPAFVSLTEALGGRNLGLTVRLADMLLTRESGATPPFLSVSAPSSIVQGETGEVWVTTVAPFPPTGRFQGRELVFIGEGRDKNGFHFAALIPTGALDKPGEKPLRIRVGDAAWEQPVRVLEGQYETQHIVLPPSKDGLLAPKKLKNERELLAAIWKRVTGPPKWSEPFRFPIGEGFHRTSPYGTRRSYNGGPVASYHAGSDWGAPEGTPILAPAPGVVVLAENLDVRGGAVVVDHGAGVYSNFWHMSRIDVQPGDVVQPGDQLGLVGTTGLSTGAHLHWEIRVNGLAVDPMQWTEIPLLTR